ncbi:MAG: precorrin-2 C(20)-methyltransferase [Isosphaeraceae bacterium]
MAVAMGSEAMGRFYAVGVGPGDPELLTLRAARILSEVDSIYYPSGARGGLARKIIDGLGRPESVYRAVPMPMSRDRSAARAAYVGAAAAIVEELKAGRSSAWITEGDPLFYSTFIHLRDELRALVPGLWMEIVPGVTSVQAGAARAGMALARLDDRVAIIPAAYGIGRLPALLEPFTTVVLMKINRDFDRLLDLLVALPWPVRAVYLERIGQPGERVVTDLESLRGRERSYFSMVIVRRTPESVGAVEDGVGP